MLGSIGTGGGGSDHAHAGCVGAHFAKLSSEMCKLAGAPQHKSAEGGGMLWFTY